MSGEEMLQIEVPVRDARLLLRYAEEGMRSEDPIRCWVSAGLAAELRRRLRTIDT